MVIAVRGEVSADSVVSLARLSHLCRVLTVRVCNFFEAISIVCRYFLLGWVDVTLENHEDAVATFHLLSQPDARFEVGGVCSVQYVLQYETEQKQYRLVLLACLLSTFLSLCCLRSRIG